VTAARDSGGVASPSLATMHDVALLDLDGVVYIGDHAVPGAADALAAARRSGMTLAFVTNNAGRPPEEVAAHLEELGIPADVEQVVTSAQAGAEVLARHLPAGADVLAVGGPGVALALVRVGLNPVRAQGEQPGDVRGVLQGFGRDTTWGDLAAAALAVQAGALWVVTNPDRTFPVPGGRAPGNGSLATAVEAAAGQAPYEIAGKPYPALMRASLERTHARRPIVVGDRLDTDIAGAAQVGVPSLLVLSGICDVVGLLQAGPGERPEYVGADLGALLTRPASTQTEMGGPRPDSGGWSLGPARADVRDGAIEVVIAGGDWLAGLQCCCAAAWHSPAGTSVSAAAAAVDTARRSVGA